MRRQQSAAWERAAHWSRWNKIRKVSATSHTALWKEFRAASSRAREAACCGASASIAYTKTFASMNPGSTDIVVEVQTVERPHYSKMPEGQFGGRTGKMSCYPELPYEPFQQCFHGDTLPPASSVRRPSVSFEMFILMGAAAVSGYRDG